MPTDDEFDYYSHCPACGSPIDYCLGHGDISDPRGRRILEMHDDGFHENCHSTSDCHDIWGD